MSLPMSLRTALSKIRKRADALQESKIDFHVADRRQEAEIEVGEILVSLALLLDKAMNAVFVKYGIQDGRKPNIYFPECSDAEKFDERMKKDKMGDLANRNPSLYALLQEPQPYLIGQNGWWEHLRRLALKRHEEYPEIVPGSFTGLGLGSPGQAVYFESLSIDNGVVNVTGARAWNQATGLEEALNMNFFGVIEEEIKGTGLNPISFVDHCVTEASAYLMKIGVHI